MKIESSDNWFYKMGILGFHRIIEFNKNQYDLDTEKYNYKVLENSIEFDVELLSEFPTYYFRYFCNEYNVAKNVRDKFEYMMEWASKKENFKKAMTEVKKLIKDKNKKIEVLKVSNFIEFNSIYDKVLELAFDDIDEIKVLLERYVTLFSDEKVNIPQSVNLFKSILNSSFYGQDSFLNVCNNGKTIEDQQKIMYTDYVKPVIEMEKLNKHISLNGFQNIDKYIEDNMETEKGKITEVDKYMKSILKNLYSKKPKFKSLQEYNVVLDKCVFCNSNLSYGISYADGSFVPLAISNGNTNLFWNMEAKFPLCPVCKLILLCNAAGTTKVYKNYLDSSDISDKMYYGFISIEGSLKNLIKENNTFKNLSSKDISFEEWLYDSMKQENKISAWQLQNILYVEFNADYRSKNSKLNYYNIPNYIANFLCDEFKMIEGITSSTDRVRVFEYIISRKELGFLIDDELRKRIKGEFVSSNILGLIRIKSVLEVYKRKGKGEKMDKGSLEIIDRIYKDGIFLAKYYHTEKMENKLPGISYRLLNAVKAGNKNDFMDSVLRIYMSAGRQVPKQITEAVKEENLSFSQVGHSFLAGLNGYYEKDKKDGVING